jgi:hypothetical protein
MRILKGIARFCYDFVIGDDWKIAAAVVASLLAGFVGLVAGLPATVVVVGTAVLVAAAFAAALVIDVRR